MQCLLLQRVLAIVGLGVIIGAADSWIRPTTIVLKLDAPPAVVPASPRMPSALPKEPAPKAESEETQVRTETAASAQQPEQLGVMIDAVAAKRLFDEGAVFLDARIASEFKAGHVPQAFHLNTSTFGTPAAADAMKALDPTQPAVIYCGGGDCDASKNLAILLQGAGYTRLHIFEAGFPDWEKHGFPVEKEKP